ncbi:hypothetical protein [Speluncibacter jeojiensis]|uniref:ESX-1 secretion-associated protein n=1 Tax=Speluncibacter jeojiensis TaxID=2710754 RepID=A0A9X4M2L1_9ACTN|nr:hypothetical protein [Corynebacteriales bacterium D3-21]
MATLQVLAVDAGLLRQLGADLQGQADQVTGLDAAPVFDPIAGALTGSDTARACAQAPAAIKAVLAQVSGRLSQMSQTASSNATAYEEAEQAFFDQLCGLGGGL